MTRRFIKCLTITLSLILPTTLVHRTIAAAGDPIIAFNDLRQNPAFAHDADEIDQLYRNNDLDGMEKFAETIQTKWGILQDTDYYFALSKGLVTRLAPHDFGANSRERRLNLCRKYALVALKKPNCPFDIAPDLLFCTAYPDLYELSKGKITADEWATERHDRTIQWLTMWQRLDAAILANPEPSFKDPKYIQAAQDAYQTPAGSAESIAGHAILIEYNKVFNVAHVLKLRKTFFVDHAVKVIVEYYSQKPCNTDELTALLAAYVPDSDVDAKRAILDQVTKSISANSSPPASTIPASGLAK